MSVLTNFAKGSEDSILASFVSYVFTGNLNEPSNNDENKHGTV